MNARNAERGFDIVVVGAGPGGMGTAYYAARLGLRVALLEKDRLPRDRVCGDGMLAQTVAEMERLGLGDWLLEPQHGVIEGFSVRTKMSRFSEPLPPDPRASRGYVVRRREFEPKILERALSAGATLYEGVEARRLLRSPTGTVQGLEAVSEEGETIRFEAPLVAIAGGFGGGLEDGGYARGAAAMVVSRQYFADVPDPGPPGRDYLQVWYTGEISDLGVGYGRIFYLGDGSANVGVAVYGRNLPGEPAARKAVIRRLHEVFLQQPEVSRILSSANPEEEVRDRTFGAGGFGIARHGEGLLYVGDAGGTSHPVSGEGIGFALEAGRLAAGWAAEAHMRRDYSAAFLSGYAEPLGLRGATKELAVAPPVLDPRPRRARQPSPPPRPYGADLRSVRDGLRPAPHGGGGPGRQCRCERPPEKTSGSSSPRHRGSDPQSRHPVLKGAGPQRFVTVLALVPGSHARATIPGRWDCPPQDGGPRWSGAPSSYLRPVPLLEADHDRFLPPVQHTSVFYPDAQPRTRHAPLATHRAVAPSREFAVHGYRREVFGVAPGEAVEIGIWEGAVDPAVTLGGVEVFAPGDDVERSFGRPCYRVSTGLAVPAFAVAQSRA